MKYFLVTLLISVAISTHTYCQDTVITNRSDTVYGGIFAKVETESEFPGGRQGWQTFLMENLTYPSKAQRKNIEGTVVLQFIVNKDGSLNDIEAISGPQELRKAALDVIHKSPRWIPAEQSGKKVRSYKKQPIAFRLR